MLSSLFSLAAVCSDKKALLGFPSWYHYLNCQDVNGAQSPQIDKLTDIWLIVAAITEMMLRIAAVAAVGFVIWGGIQYMTSQGDPGKTTQARTTITNALVGLAISILAAGAVSFIAGRFN